MKGKVYILVIVVLGILGMYSCVEKPVGPLDIPIDYFPIELSNTWVYEYERIDYSPGVVTQMDSYVKDSITAIDETEGAKYVRIQRYSRTSNSEAWELSQLWSIEISNQRLIFTKDNVAVINWVFPPISNKQWNGNAFNTEDNQLFEMMEVGIPYMDSNQADNLETVTVLQWDNEDLIVELEQSIEVFGKGVGIIESIKRSYIYCQEPSCLGQQQVDVGFYERYTLLEYIIN